MNHARRPSIGAPPYSRNLVIQKAEEFVREYADCIRSDGLEISRVGMSFDGAYDALIYPRYEIELIDDLDLGVDVDGVKVLGKYEPEHNVAFLDQSLQPKLKDPRRTFVAWHEVGGHGILQGEWLRAELRNLGARSVITTEESIQFTYSERLESQANLYAAHVGAPAALLLHFLRRRLGFTKPFRYVGPGEYSLMVDERHRSYSVDGFHSLARIVASHVKQWFGGMSVDALAYQLSACRLVIDCSAGPRVLKRRESHRSRSAFAAQ